MGKRVATFRTFELILAIIMAVANFGCTVPQEEIGVFDVNDYTETIARFRSTLVVEPITNADVAKAVAERIWLDTYDERVLEQKPYVVMRDDANGVWLVRGTLPKGLLGGEPFIIIEDSGCVLAVWHEKQL